MEIAAYLTRRGSYFVQNYTAGNPSSVLYIKNLAKDVVAEDFYFIFGEFIVSAP